MPRSMSNRYRRPACQPTSHDSELGLSAEPSPVTRKKPICRTLRASEMSTSRTPWPYHAAASVGPETSK